MGKEALCMPESSTEIEELRARILELGGETD